MACLGSVWGMMSFSLSPKLIAPVYVECDCPCARLRIWGTLSDKLLPNLRGDFNFHELKVVRADPR